MKKIRLVIWLCILPIYAYAQINNELIKNNSVKSFFEKNISNNKLDYNNIDFALLEATFYFNLNEKRRNRLGDVYKYNNQLVTAAHDCIKEKRGVYFKPTSRKKNRVKKILKKLAVKKGYYGTYIDLSFNYMPVLKYKDYKKYIYGGKVDRGEEGVFYYKNNNKEKELEEVPFHTYQSFVEECLKKVSSIRKQSLRHAKVYSDIGIAVSIEQKAENRMPYIKVLWVYGGSRLGTL